MCLHKKPTLNQVLAGLKEFKFNFIKEINEHLVNFSVCSKCETIIMNITLPDHKLNLNTPV